MHEIRFLLCNIAQFQSTRAGCTRNEVHSQHLFALLLLDNDAKSTRSRKLFADNQIAAGRRFSSLRRGPGASDIIEGQTVTELEDN